jgi:adenosylhomocysteine nucleosidase
MADEVVDTHQRRLSVGLHVDRAAVEATPSLHVGRLLTVDRLIRTSDEKRRLGAEYEASACDMETMAVAEVCQREKTRFLSVRVVSDAVDDELPKEIERLLDQKSMAAKLGAATGAIFNRLSSIKDMWKLKEDAIKASDRLAKFLVGVVAQLPAETPPRSRGE